MKCLAISVSMVLIQEIFILIQCEGHSCQAANMTMVTALYDIRRSEWLEWSRDFQDYRHYFSFVLQLDVPMALFVDKTLQRFVKEKRKGKEHKTKIYTRKFTELECYKHKQRIQHILSSKNFRLDNQMINNPEGNSTEYIIITNNKPYIVKYVSDKNPFNTTHFFWIDAGYGHGEVEFPENRSWNPCTLLEIERKITILKLVDLEAFQAQVLPNKLHKLNIYPPFAGGFFGGDSKAVSDYYEIYDKVFRSLLAEDIVDDDQSVAYHSYNELPRLFNLVEGNFFDIFKLYPN